MSPRLRKCPLAHYLVIRKALVVPSLVVFVLVTTAHAQKIDLNHNGVSDIWEEIFGASALDPNADTDGDGVPNQLEALAGTDPFDSSSAPRISVAGHVGNVFSVTIPSQLGKQYQLQSVTPSGPGGWSNWTAEASTTARGGSSVTLNG